MAKREWDIPVKQTRWCSKEKKARGSLVVGSVAAPSGGDDVLQWRRVRVTLYPGKSGEKWRVIEAIVGNWEVGVREVLVLELRRIVSIECLHTFVLKIKN